MASDEKILDELHFLSWKIDTLERKLESSMSIQRDLAASLLQEDSSFAGSVSASKKFERRNLSGSSCSEAVSSDDEHTVRFQKMNPNAALRILLYPSAATKTMTLVQFQRKNKLSDGQKWMTMLVNIPPLMMR